MRRRARGVRRGAASLRSRPAANQRAAARPRPGELDLRSAESVGSVRTRRPATGPWRRRRLGRWRTRGQVAMTAVGAVAVVVLPLCWLGPALGSDVHGRAVDAQGRRCRAGAGTRPRPLQVRPNQVGWGTGAAPLIIGGPPRGQAGLWHAAAQPRWHVRRRCGSRRSGRRAAWPGKDRVVGAACARPGCACFRGD